MQEEEFPAAERIVSTIDKVLNRDQNIQDFDTILSPVDDNTCPIVYVAAEHCLGIKSWCVKPLHKYVYCKLMKIKNENKYKKNVLSVDEFKEIEKLLTVAVLLNPEVSTFWNMRRELTTKDKLDANKELTFCSIVSSYKPKTSEVYIYRRWILNFIKKEISNEVWNEKLDEEFNMVYKMGDKYPNNYNAWNHALWCFNQAKYEIQEKQLSQSEQWVLYHVSDHSGMQFRQQVLKKLLQWCEGSTVCEICPCWYKTYKINNNIENKYSNHYIHELVTNHRMIMSFPGHESCWCHRRFIVHEIFKSDPNIKEYLKNEEKQLKIDQADENYKLKYLSWIDKFL